MNIPSLVEVKLVGSHYYKGTKFNGYAVAYLSNGTTIHVPSEKAFFDGVIEFLGDRVETSSYRKRLDKWVETGKMPRANEV